MEKQSIIASAPVSLIEFDDATKLLIGAALQELAEQVDIKSQLQEDNCCVDDVTHNLQQQDTGQHAGQKNIVSQNDNAIIGNAHSMDDTDDDDDNDLCASFSDDDVAIWNDANEQYNSEAFNALLKESRIWDKNTSKKFEENILYLCPKCGRRFSNKNDWLEHTNNVHQLNIFNTFKINMFYNEKGQETYECQICKKTMVSRITFKSLKGHYIGHQAFSRYKLCKICLKSYTKTGNIRRHFIKSHPNESKEEPEHVELNLDKDTHNMSDALVNGDAVVSRDAVVNESMQIIENEKSGIDANVYNDVYEIIEIDENLNSQVEAAGNTAVTENMFLIENVKSLVDAKVSKAIVEDAVAVCEDVVEQDKYKSSNFEDSILYKCPQCGQDCANREHWMEHISHFHDMLSLKTYNLNVYLNAFGRKNYECRTCKEKITKSTNRLDTLRTHYISHLPFNKYLTCKICMNSYGSFFVIKRHLLSSIHQYKMKNVLVSSHRTSQVEAGNTAVTENMFLIENVKSLVNAQVSNATAEDAVAVCEDVVQQKKYKSSSYDDCIIYICPQCGQDCSNREHWLDHISHFHDMLSLKTYNLNMYLDECGRKNYECRTCKEKITKSTNRLDKLRTHYISHLPFNKHLTCKFCKKSFASFNASKLHLLRSHKYKLKNKLVSSPRTNLESDMQYEGDAAVDNKIFNESKLKIGNEKSTDDVNVFNDVYESLDIVENIRSEYDAGNSADYENMLIVQNLKSEIDVGITAVAENTIIIENVKSVVDAGVNNDIVEIGVSERENLKSDIDIGITAVAENMVIENVKSVVDGDVNNDTDETDETDDADETYETNSTANTEENIIFTCPECGKICANKATWLQHIEDVHDLGSLGSYNLIMYRNEQGRKNYECRICNQKITKSTNRMETLRTHYFTHLPIKRCLTCKICNQSYGSVKIIKCHLLKIHKQKLKKQREITAPSNSDSAMQCESDTAGDDDDSDTEIDKLLNETNSTDTSTKADDNIIFTCPQCGRICKNHKEWLQHTNDVHDMTSLVKTNMRMYLNEHGQKIYDCRICKLKIDKKTNNLELKTHYIKHLPYNKFLSCKICNRAYGSFRVIRFHIVQYHQIPKKKSGKKSHEDDSDADTDDSGDDGTEDSDDNSTTKSKKFEKSVIFQCPQCGKICVNKNAWIKHTNRVHAFKSLETYNMNYIDNEHGKRNYWCQICNKKLSKTRGYSFASLKTHYITHLPYANYLTCNICYTNYNSLYKIKQHITVSHLPNGNTFKKNIKNIMKYVRIICQVCAEPQPDRQQLYRHLQVAHQFWEKSMESAVSIADKMCTCNLCNIRVYLKSFEPHMLLHQPHKPFVCTLCPRFNNNSYERTLKHIYDTHQKELH